jgi:threonine dehydrogenase-like Zn-dependent dehydrogenase
LTGVWFRELDVLGAFGQQLEQWAGRQLTTYQLVLELMSSGKMKCDGMLTHTFPLADYRRALSAVTAKKSTGVIKAAFKF